MVQKPKASSSRGHVSKLAFAVAMALPICSTHTLAEQVSEDVEVINVTGIRGSLQRSIATKRDTIAISDTISAEDIGKFPDSNVAESLQRITGVAIDRSGGEGQFITVRGFGPEFNTVLVNGRTMATENDGREFSFDVLASEMISGAQVYKSPAAHMQEGGIGATVNVTTAKPFDYQGLKVAGSLKGMYETIDGDISPAGSIMLSQNWDNTLGALLSVSYSKRESKRDNAMTEGWMDTSLVEIYDGDQDGAMDSVRTLEDISVPRSYRLRRLEEERERLNANLALQFSPSDNLVFTLDALYSDYEVESHSLSHQAYFKNPFMNVELDENRTVVAFDRIGMSDVAGFSDELKADIQALTGNSPESDIAQNDNIMIWDHRPTKTHQVGFNADWQVTDDLNIALDLSQSHAEKIIKGQRPFVNAGFLSQGTAHFELGDKDLPYYNTDDLSNFDEFTDKSLLRAHFLMNGDTADIEDDVTEFKLDATYELGINTIKAGVYAGKREKARRKYRSDWAPNLAYTGYWHDFPQEMEDKFTIYRPDGFLSDASGEMPRAWISFDPYDVMDYLVSSRPEAEMLEHYPGEDDWREAGWRSGHRYLNTLLLEPDSTVVEEEIQGLYVDWTLDLELGSMTFTPNFGLRYVETETSATGVNTSIVSVARADGDNKLNIQYANSDAAVTNDYSNLLPSMNLKLDVTDELTVRLSAAKTVTRPTLTDIGVNNYVNERVDNLSITGGNPYLEPFESDNIDLAVEYFPTPMSFIGLTLFNKKIDKFLSSNTEDLVYKDADNPSIEYTFKDTRVRNNESATAKGFEFALQHAFENGLGGQLNYTYVESSAEYSPGVEAYAIEGLSPHSYNIVVFYEKNGFNIRLAYNYRDEFLIRSSGQQGAPETREAYGQLDLSASVDISDNLSLFLEGINLTDEDTKEYSVYKNRFKEWDDTGSRYTVGIRAKF